MPTVSIVYPADPTGVVPGGIDTFIRGIAKYAPADIKVRVVGITTDAAARPVGQWSECPVGRGSFALFPVLAVHAAGARGRVPLSLRFSAAVARHRDIVDGDVLEFHRLEPALLFASDRRAKNAFIHQNMKELRNRKSDILWSRAPWLYYRLEGRLLPGFASVYVVREDAVAWYQERFPAIRDRFHFTPTWVDPDDFQVPSNAERNAARLQLEREFGIHANTDLLVTVGRLDSQKDPLLLAEAFQMLARQRPSARLLYVGDGVLRDALEKRLRQGGLGDKAIIAGLRSTREIAAILRAADLFVLTSAYEGMPMSVLEALGCGVPVVTTDVGEVRRVVLPGRSGAIAPTRAPDVLAATMAATLGERHRLAGQPCQEAVSPYTPARVLEPVYANYRRIALGL